MLRKWMTCACVWATLAGAGSAGPLQHNALDSDNQAWFYNRPGATVSGVANDRFQCESFSTSTMPYAMGNTAVVSQYGIGGIIGAALVDAAQEGTRKALADDCMIGLGYRRFTTEDRNLAAFTARFDAMGAENQAALVGAETPSEGALARQWVNSYWVPREDDPAPADAPRSVQVYRSFPVRMREWDALDDGDPIVLGPTDALLVVSLTSHPRASLRFIRESALAVEGRRQPVMPFIEPALRSARDDGDRTRTFLYVVPAGVYSLSSAQASGENTEFCLGSPYVSVEPGSAVFLGEIALQAGRRDASASAPPARFGIHISVQELEEARSVLAGQQDLATRLEAARYQNGHSRGCTGNVIYGLDVPGAPWAPRGGFATLSQGGDSVVKGPTSATTEQPASEAPSPQATEPPSDPQTGLSHGPGDQPSAPPPSNLQSE